MDNKTHDKPDIVDVVSKYTSLTKETSGEFKGKCPLHSEKTPSFFVNKEKQIFYCFGCSESGDVYDFLMKKENLPFKDVVNLYGDIDTAKLDGVVGRIDNYLPPPKKQTNFDMKLVLKYNQALLNNTEILDIVVEYWALSEETVRHFKLGYKVEKETGQEWIVFPYIEKGKCIFIKYRTVPTRGKKTFKRITGTESTLFNLDSIAETPDTTCFIAEGESKVMALYEKGIYPVAGNSIGSISWNSKWNAYFEKFDTIVIVYDNDDVGKQGAMKLAGKLGLDRCVVVILPDDNGIKDINDYFKYHSAEEFSALVAKAERDKTYVSPIMDAWSDLQEHMFLKDANDSASKVFPWDSVNDLAKVDNGELIVVSATPAQGKTTWLINVMLNLAKQDIPVLFICLEMMPHILLKKLIACGEKYNSDDIDIEFLMDIKNRYQNLPFYFGYIKDSKMLKINVIEEIIRRAIRKYGIKYVVFDHLDFLCRNLKYVVQETAQCIQTFKLIAQQTGIDIFCVHHPKKTDDMDTIINMYDLKNSASVAADADRVIILHRRRQGDKKAGEGEYDGFSLSNYAIVRFDKNRLDPEGQTVLYYEGAKSLFRELTKDEKEDYELQKQEKKSRRKKYTR